MRCSCCDVVQSECLYVEPRERALGTLDVEAPAAMVAALRVTEERWQELRRLAPEAAHRVDRVVEAGDLVVDCTALEEATVRAALARWAVARAYVGRRHEVERIEVRVHGGELVERRLSTAPSRRAA